MDIQTLLWIGALGAGLGLAAGLLYILARYGLGWLNGSPQAAPSSVAAQPPVVGVVAAPRRTLAGLSWMIAVTHRSVSQLTGLIMSFATLIAIILSVVCAVAGIAIISYQQFSNLALTLVAAAATLILALLIENTSINALKTIRIANEEIAQAEKAHYVQIVKQMEEQFEEDTQAFAQVNQQTLTKTEVKSMQLAAGLKLQARKQFEKKRRGLMREQTRTARHNRRASIPFAIVGVLFSASAGGLFWHTVLASLSLWLNLTVGTMFALAVSVTFVQSELLKRIKDEAIGEALQSGEMQHVMLKQQSEEMVLELVVDSIASVKADPATLVEMSAGVKEELKTTISALTRQATSRLTDEPNAQVVQVDSTANKKVGVKRQRKEPEWLSHPALSVILKSYPKLNENIASWRAVGRVSISIVALVNATNHSKKVVQNRIKDGTLKVSSHNANLVLLNSVLDWLRDVEVPVVKNGASNNVEEVLVAAAIDTVPVSQSDPVTDAIEALNAVDGDAVLDENATLPSGWEAILSVALDAVREKSDVTDEELAVKLGFKRAGSARFWKIKALDMLAQGQKEGNGHGEPVPLDQLVQV